MTQNSHVEIQNSNADIIHARRGRRPRPARRGRARRHDAEEAGVFALAGGPAYSNNVTVDGLDNNDDRAARERLRRRERAKLVKGVRVT
jgi:hypothetical protein